MPAQAKRCRPSSPQLIVAYSGGLDSTVLLHLCCLFFGTESILAVHVNHGLQKASRDFEAHVKRICAMWGVRLQVQRLTGKPDAQQSVEAWARTERYRVLRTIANGDCIAHVFTAHHLDDQMESLLIALSRGSGLEGLRGIAATLPMPAASGQHAFTIHRPLLACSRESLEDYARQAGLDWIDDPSNQDLSFLRNKLRHKLIPLLTEQLPGFAKASARSMKLVAEAVEVLDQKFEVSALASPMLARSQLQRLQRSARALGLRAWIKSLGLPVPSYARLTEMDKQLIMSEGVSGEVQHAGYVFKRYRDQSWIEAVPQMQVPQTQLPAMQKPPTQMTQAESLVEERAKSEGGPPTDHIQMWLSEFQGYLTLRVRARKGLDLENPFASLASLKIKAARGGLRMRPRAKGSSRSLKHLFQEAGIPATARENLPCVYLGDELLFVPGLPVSESSAWDFEFARDQSPKRHAL